MASRSAASSLDAGGDLLDPGVCGRLPERGHLVLEPVERIAQLLELSARSAGSGRRSPKPLAQTRASGPGASAASRVRDDLVDPPAERVDRGGHIVLPAGGRLDPGRELFDRSGRRLVRGRAIRQAGLDPLEARVESRGFRPGATRASATAARRSARTAAWRSSSADAALSPASDSTLAWTSCERLAEVVERGAVGQLLERRGDLVDAAPEPVVGDGPSSEALHGGAQLLETLREGRIGSRGLRRARHDLRDRGIDAGEVEGDARHAALEAGERLLDAAGDALEAVRERGQRRLDALRAGDGCLDPLREIGESLVGPVARRRGVHAPGEVGNGVLQSCGVLVVVVVLRRPACGAGFGTGRSEIERLWSDHCSASALASSSRVITPC